MAIFSKSQNLWGLDKPHPHMGMPMMCNNLLEAKLTNIRSLNFLEVLHSISSWFHLVSNFFFVWSIAFFSWRVCLWDVQNVNIHGLVVLSPWPPKTNKRITKFICFHVKPMFVMHMLMNQPLNHITIGAYIDLTHAPWLFMYPIHIFHCIFCKDFSIIIFMRSHLRPYK
jgi:hypothetical protein